MATAVHSEQAGLDKQIYSWRLQRLGTERWLTDPHEEKLQTGTVFICHWQAEELYKHDVRHANWRSTAPPVYQCQADRQCMEPWPVVVKDYRPMSAIGWKLWVHSTAWRRF